MVSYSVQHLVAVRRQSCSEETVCGPARVRERMVDLAPSLYLTVVRESQVAFWLVLITMWFVGCTRSPAQCDQSFRVVVSIEMAGGSCLLLQLACLLYASRHNHLLCGMCTWWPARGTSSRQSNSQRVWAYKCRWSQPVRAPLYTWRLNLRSVSESFADNEMSTLYVKYTFQEL